jgi:hypothetical protein
VRRNCGRYGRSSGHVRAIWKKDGCNA